MSFFFTNQKHMGKRTTKQQRSTAALNRIGCAACPLNKAKVNSPKMQPTLADETWIYFLGMTPWKDEDEEGRPFVGKSGNLLRHCIPYELEDYCSFDNIVRDKGPDPAPEMAAIECCRGLVTKTIEQVKPKLIIGLGEPVLNWMLGTTDGKGLRGRVFTVKVGSHSCYFMPTYHPARVLRAAGEQAKRQGRDPFKLTINEYLRSLSGRTFKLDLEKAFKLVETLKPPVIETKESIIKKIITFNGDEGVFEYLIKAKKAKVKAIDIETNRLRPYELESKILSTAISFNNVNFAFSLDHRNSKWTQAQRNRILSDLTDIVSDDTIKIAHNAPFECEWFAFYLGKESINHAAWECTQLQCSFIDERRGPGQSSDEDTKKATYQSLNFLVKMYFGVPFKQWFEVDRKNMGSADLAETLVYNAADTFFTLQLWHYQRDILSTEGLLNAYEMALPRQVTVSLMQHLGMPVNQVTVKRLQKKLDEEIAVIDAEINMVDVVQTYKKKHKEFNPLGEDAIVIFRDYLKREEIYVQDGDKVKVSIDKNILERVDHPLAKLIVKMRNKRKMKSTYVDEFELGKGSLVYPDRNIHCNFNTTFTTTGRLSSDQPNMQNWPHRSDPWLREQVEAPDGYVIVAADYGQLEMCGAAMCSADPYLVKVLWDDYDTHMFWAARLAAICPDRVGGDFSDRNVAKAFRSLIKNKLVFPAIYGATNSSIAGYLGIELHYVDQLMDEFWDTFRGVKKWQNELLRNYRESGYVEAPTGRRRHHPLTANEAINAPIQCLASDIVVEAMCKLSYIAATENRWHLHPRLNIHDDLSFIIPEKKLVSSIENIYTTMLTPSIMDQLPEGARVPLSVTVSMGKDWFHMSEVGKFWSHKDV